MKLQNIKMDKDRSSYVLAFDKVLPMLDKCKIAESLIEETEAKIHRKIWLLIGEDGFDDVDIMKMFLRKKRHFIVRADQDSSVKDIIQSEAKGLSCYVEFGLPKAQGRIK
jgi:hypothetical protein